MEELTEQNMTKIIHNLECSEETEEEEVREDAVTLLSNGSILLLNTTVLSHQAYCFIKPNTVKICRARSDSDNYSQLSSADYGTEARYCIILASLLVLTLTRNNKLSL